MADTQSSLAPRDLSAQQHRSRQIDSGAWAVFLILLSGVMVGGLPLAWFLVGLGVLMLSVQLIRRQQSVKIETFDIVVGFIILATGIWDLLALPLPLMPILLIVLGGYQFWKTLSLDGISR
ncbi:hypothetical protein [Bradyrhizobium sp. Ai1a-2]|uniref:hypothetical protein n=1 Tax=Bradyrhizobium sp. Ai1a-2 TaxID=196490 RepID=UPI000485D4CD|nr:hypothetical protein [Bradyrhizobium sp. Ai1a-2]